MVSELKLVVFPDAGAFPNASSGEENAVLPLFAAARSETVFLSFPVAAKRISASLTTDLFGTSVNKSYQCHAQEKAYLNVDGAEETVELSMKSVQLEAFRTKSDDSFSSGNRFFFNISFFGVQFLSRPVENDSLHPPSGACKFLVECSELRP